MASLSRGMRRDLERVVKDARRVAELGARKALKELAVQEHEPAPGLSPDQRRLRNRLRTHGRQLGDRRDDKRGTQETDRLASECAYEHWHRLLFARFLAECHLLIEPATGVAISLDECRELALERSTDWLLLASGFAERMLPQIFRAGDPALEVALPPESRQKLEELLKSLPSEVFTADDSLGWVYQFWQAERKKQVNDSGVKIGADQLAAVTQLFTEDYMVLFLLHNTLGAWWSAKRIAEGKEPTVPGYEWTYLRLQDDGSPAAGTFHGWPKAAKDLRLLDPCMGSGHFLVFALPILVGLRMEEESLSRAEAVECVLRDNLFGLELDPRCTQIAAFNLALTAWKLVGYRQLPPLNLACTGLGINARESDWVALAEGDSRRQTGMRRLYQLFEQAPTLGSLIDPGSFAGDLLEAGYKDLEPLMSRALAREGNDAVHELAVAARGIAQAAWILSRQYTLVATNIPYLSGRKQAEALAQHIADKYPHAKSNLAVAFIERIRGLTEQGGAVAIVTPQLWLFTPSYEELRRRSLSDLTWDFLVRLGPGAFETISGHVVNVALVVTRRAPPSEESSFAMLDATTRRTVQGKREYLRTGEVQSLNQSSQRRNPGHRIGIKPGRPGSLLSEFVSAPQGIKTGDDGRWIRQFWEVPKLGGRWEAYQTTVKDTQAYAGRDLAIDWATEGDGMVRPRVACVALGRAGVAVSQTGALPATLYSGTRFDSNVAALVPTQPSNLAALWAFCSSPEYAAAVRSIDQSLKVSNVPLTQVSFDPELWRRKAAERFPGGLPVPESSDATQWLFPGWSSEMEQPLQVAVLRMLGYRWPRENGFTVLGSTEAHAESWPAPADEDGIVSLAALRGKGTAADRLRALLASTFGSEWSANKEHELLVSVGSGARSLDAWLRDAFFEQHCELFRQRPLAWHVWDGAASGFGALVNYHRIAGPNGEGRRTLEKLIYTYLGDWIDRQRDEQRAGTEGADARVAAASHLKRELERVLEGEPPHDLFVRWKPLHQQAVGWEPDVNDGVRVNVRPFLAARPLAARAEAAGILRFRPSIDWDKDGGKEPERPRQDFPWFWGWDGASEDFPGGPESDGKRWNDLHYTRAFKLAARDRHALRQEAKAR